MAVEGSLVRSARGARAPLPACAAAAECSARRRAAAAHCPLAASSHHPRRRLGRLGAHSASTHTNHRPRAAARGAARARPPRALGSLLLSVMMVSALRHRLVSPAAAAHLPSAARAEAASFCAGRAAVFSTGDVPTGPAGYSEEPGEEPGEGRTHGAQLGAKQRAARRRRADGCACRRSLTHKLHAAAAAPPLASTSSCRGARGCLLSR